MPRSPSQAKDRKIGADGFTEVAVHAILFFFHIGIMIALAIELIGKSQDVLRAIFDAKTAALAPLNIDMELSMWNFYFVYI